MGMAKARDALEALYDGLVSARDDIRQKVVEEPWFGRAVTPETVGVVQEAGQERDKLAELYAERLPDAQEREQEKERGIELEH